MAKYLRSDFANLVGAATLAYNEKIHQLMRNGQKIYHFGFGQSPFPIPKCAIDGLKRYAYRGEYLAVSGLEPLREKLAALHSKWDGFKVEPSNILLASGSKQLLYLVMTAFSGEILLPSPSWAIYRSQCQFVGRPYKVIPSSFEDRYLITAANLEKVLKTLDSGTNKMLIMNSPNNPSGMVFPEQNLLEISEICRKYDVLVISDEIYARLSFDGNCCTIAKFCPERTIRTTGFSKWLSAGGWRLGYAIFPSELREFQKAIANAASNTHTSAPTPIQYAMLEALQNEEELEIYEKHCRRILKAIADYCHRALTNAGCGAHRSEAAYYFMPDFGDFKDSLAKRGIFTAQQMCDAILNEAGVALMPCNPDYLRPDGEFTVRFCFINFDGTNSLKASEEIGFNREISDEFLKQYCKETLDGVQALLRWLEALKK